jgi:hypothetical protein
MIQSQNNFTPIYVGEKKVGKVRDNTFYKSISEDHYLRYPPAIAFDINSLDLAERVGAIGVHVADKDTGVIYQSSIAFIRKYGTVFNRGHGVQIFLTVGNWITHKRGGSQLSLFGSGT